MDIMLALPFFAGGIRSIAGWLENAMEDGHIDKFEWGLLGKTVVEVAMLGFGAMFGLGMDAASASGLAVLGSFAISAIRKAGRK